jgi:hypothetical protein
MLVICCGMMRSGSTLQYQLAVAIVEKRALGCGLGEARNSNCQDLITANFNNQIQVVKVHQFSHLQGAKEAVAQGQATCIYIYRDIRDVTVSLMKMRKWNFDRLIFGSKEIQQCLKDFNLWTSIPEIYISSYENMMQDLKQEVARIAQHLKIELSPEEITEIAQNHSLQQQKNKIKTWKWESGKNSGNYEPKTLLHYNHINSGKSQQWRDSLNQIQLGYLESIAKKWMETQGYTLSQPIYLRWLSQLVFIGYLIKEKINRVKQVLASKTLNKPT